MITSRNPNNPNNPRAGGGTLTVTGENFGVNAVVFVGPNMCTNVVHNSTTPENKLTCELPYGPTYVNTPLKKNSKKTP